MSPPRRTFKNFPRIFLSHRPRILDIWSVFLCCTRCVVVIVRLLYVFVHASCVCACCLCAVYNSGHDGLHGVLWLAGRNSVCVCVCAVHLNVCVCLWFVLIIRYLCRKWASPRKAKHSWCQGQPVCVSLCVALHSYELNCFVFDDSVFVVKGATGSIVGQIAKIKGCRVGQP